MTSCRAGSRDKSVPSYRSNRRVTLNTGPSEWTGRWSVVADAEKTSETALGKRTSHVFPDPISMTASNGRDVSSCHAPSDACLRRAADADRWTGR